MCEFPRRPVFAGGGGTRVDVAVWWPATVVASCQSAGGERTAVSRAAGIILAMVGWVGGWMVMGSRSAMGKWVRTPGQRPRRHRVEGSSGAPHHNIIHNIVCVCVYNI